MPITPIIKIKENIMNLGATPLNMTISYKAMERKPDNAGARRGQQITGRRSGV